MRAGVGAVEAEDGEKAKELEASEMEDMVVVVGWLVGWKRRGWREDRRGGGARGGAVAG
jgi:hypothetical protein